MKKLLSVVLAAALLLQLPVGMAGADELYSETGYTFTQKAVITEKEPVEMRAFGAAVYETGGKQFAAVGLSTGLKVFDISDPASPNQLQSEMGGQFITNDVPLVLAAYNGKVYYSNKAQNNTYVLSINGDGTLDLPMTSEGKPDAAARKILNNFRALYGIDFIDGNMVTLINASGSSVFRGDTIVVQPLDAETGLASGARAEYTLANTGAAGGLLNIYGIEAIRTADGKYRICVVSDGPKETSAATSSQLNIIDYDPETKTFTPVYAGIPADEDWPATEPYLYFTYSSAVFDGETAVLLAYGKENDSKTAKKVLKVDFSNPEDVTVEVIEEKTKLSANTRSGYLSAMDDAVVSWNATTTALDRTSGQVLGSLELPNGIRVCDVDMIGSTAFVTADRQLYLIDIQKETVTEIPVDNTARKVVNPGQVITHMLVDEEEEGATDIRLSAVAAAQVGDKTIVYSEDGSRTVHAYDVTDPNAITEIGSYSYEERTAGTSVMAVYQQHLILPSGTRLYVIPINDDGTLSDTVSYVQNTGNSNNISRMELVDNLLFVNGNGNAVEVYSLDGISAGLPLVASIQKTGARSMAVEKLSNIRYRVYVTTSCRPEGWKEENAGKTVRLSIYEMLRGLEETTVTLLYDDFPDIAAVNAWPGMGIYGETDCGEGYVGFSTNDWGTLHSVRDGLLRLVVSPDSNKVNAIGSDDFYIDVTDPSAPAVVAHERKESSEYTQREIRLDSITGLTTENYGTSGYIMDYSNPEEPKKKYYLPDFTGKDIAVLGDMAYSVNDNKLCCVKLFDSGKDIAISGISVTDPDGNAATSVESGTLNISVDISNATGQPYHANLFVAMYDYYTNELEYIQCKPVTAEDFETVTDQIVLTDLSDYSAYTKYVRVFLWDTQLKALRDQKVSALTVEGTTFDIYIPEDTEVVKGIVFIHDHGMGIKFKELPGVKKFFADMDWAWISCFDGPGVLKNFKNQGQCGTVMLRAVEEFAASTGHSELVNVPFATIGHSNASEFAARFADWMPERFFGVIAYKSAFGWQFELDGLNGIPTQVIVGELDEAYGDNGQLESVINMRKDNALVHYIMDHGADHGPNQWKSNSINLLFLKAAFEARVPADADPTKGVVQLNTIDPATGWIGDVNSPNYDIAPVSQSKVENDAAWLLNETYAKQWQEFMKNAVVEGIEYQ